jgi:nitrite reductase/ring-hydroxylating ferredoxin subunit
MICGTVQCPWHGSQFSVKTGEIKAGPADKRISCYSIKEENGSGFVYGL